MLKKTVKFKDYNGGDHSEDLYFHVSKASVLTASDEVYNEIIKIGVDLQSKGKFLEQTQEPVDESADTVESVDNEFNVFDRSTQIKAESVRMIARLLDRLIDLSYGKRSEDGMKFVKNAQVLSDFKSSVVYDAFVEQMVGNQEEMIKFIEQLLAQ